MTNGKLDPAVVLQEIQNNAVQQVKVGIVDVDGVLRGKILDRDKFLSVADRGFGFCNVVFGWDSADACYSNSKFTGWHTGYPDVLVKPDLMTHREIPWEGKRPFFLCDFEDQKGGPLAICPRQLLKSVLRKAAEMGFRLMCGMEFEWFNFRETPQSLSEKKYVAPEPISPGMFGYSVLRMTQNQEYLTALLDELRAFRIPVEGLHTETGPGVLEAAILYSDALEAADRAVLFKSSVKEIAHRFGIMPSFMAKWNAQLPGCSGHIHQSLWNGSGSENLFFDPNTPKAMSELYQSYVAGQLACLPDILPMVAPNVNSYKRLVDGYWAPTQANWGVDNRTTALRIIPGSEKSTRLETRVPGSDVNPYLAMAACIASGLYGIEKGLKLSQTAVVGSAYHQAPSGKRFSKNLKEAASKMGESPVARELFGESFVEHFVQSRHWEWNQFQDSVTQWELQRYFEII